jgi:hypothetical protein
MKKMQKGGALRTLGSKIGVGVNVAGMVGTGIKAISDRVKAKKAEKKEKQAALDKKQKGGGVQKIVGMPGYNAKTNTMQKGGVSPSMMRTMKELDKKRKIGPGVPPPKDVKNYPPDTIKIPKPSFQSKPMTYSDRKKLEEKNKGGSTKRK